ncbi:MAG: MATE family efflux transporter [Rhodobacterales bacterium]|nr:MATE family efflux transporter [Rhodobacterales bacterium]
MALADVRREFPAIFFLALPIVASLSASTLLGVTDSIMLAPLGPVPLAAVGLAGAAALILYAAIYGMLSALSVRIGAAYGAGQGRQIPVILRSGLALGFIVGTGGAALMGLAYFALPWLGQPNEVIASLPAYWACISLLMIPFSVLTVFKSAFEAVGRPWLGTGFAFLAVVTNVPLNYALIWGIGPFPELGLTGAGIASLAAEALALATASTYWATAPSMRRLRLRRAINAAEIVASAKEGAPLGLLYIAETGAMAVAVAMIGTFGTIALAANQVSQSVGSLLYMLPLGVAGAVAIRVAQEKGAGNLAALRPIVWAALGLASVWLCCAAAILFLRGPEIAALITNDPQVIAVAAAIFLVFAPMQVADGVQSTMLGALRGMSDTAVPALVSMVAYWVLALPLGWVLAHHAGFGPSGIWAGFLVALVLAGVILTFRFRARTI